MRQKILLGQLGALGDCLYATAIAKQIKHDHPNCHLTWAIGTPCRSILINNPHVDEIWDIPISTSEDKIKKWFQFEEEAKNRKLNGDFDEIFLTQIHPNNYQNFDGTVRASIFRGYPNPITVPVAPVLHLTKGEIKNAKKFATKYRLAKKSQIILFEFSPNSSQSFVTPEFAFQVAKSITEKLPEAILILTSSESFISEHPNIIDGSVLSFRENAEISKYCHLLVGCSSGISWLCTSEWAKPLPTIQLLKKDQSCFASMKHDFNYFGLDSKHIIEMTDCTVDHVTNCIVSFFNNGYDKTYTLYNENIVLDFNFYLLALKENIPNQDIAKYNISISNTLKRYGSDFLFPFFVSLLDQHKNLILEKNQLKTEINRLTTLSQDNLQAIEKLNNMNSEKDNIINLLEETIFAMQKKKNIFKRLRNTFQEITWRNR